MDNIVNDKNKKPFVTDYNTFLSFVIGASMIGSIIGLIKDVISSMTVMMFDQELGKTLLIVSIAINIVYVIGALLFFIRKKSCVYFIFGAQVLNLLFLVCYFNKLGTDFNFELVKLLLKILVIFILFSLKKSSTGLCAWHILGYRLIEGKTVEQWNNEYWHEKNRNQEECEPNTKNNVVENHIIEHGHSIGEVSSNIETAEFISNSYNSSQVPLGNLEAEGTGTSLKQTTAVTSDDTCSMSYSIDTVNEEEMTHANPANKEGKEEQQIKKETIKRKYLKYSIVSFVSFLVIFALLGGYFFKSQSETKANEEYAQFKEKLLNEGLGILDKEHVTLFYELAKERKDTTAILRIAKYYYDQMEYQRMDSILLEGYKLGSIKCLNNLANYYSIQSLPNGMNNPLLNTQKAEICAKELMQYDKGAAYSIMGLLHSENKEYKIAIYYWEKGAQYNNTNCLGNLGWAYENGEGCSVDYNKSFNYFSKAYAIDKEDEYAAYHLGLHYLYGMSVPINTNKAKEFLKIAADLGSDDAKEELVDLL